MGIAAAHHIRSWRRCAPRAAAGQRRHAVGDDGRAAAGWLATCHWVALGGLGLAIITGSAWIAARPRRASARSEATLDSALSPDAAAPGAGPPSRKLIKACEDARRYVNLLRYGFNPATASALMPPAPRRGHPTPASTARQPRTRFGRVEQEPSPLHLREAARGGRRRSPRLAAARAPGSRKTPRATSTPRSAELFPPHGRCRRRRHRRAAHRVRR